MRSNSKRESNLIKIQGGKKSKNEQRFKRCAGRSRKEKNISKDTLLEAIEQSLIQACKNHFGKADNVHVMIDPETCDFSVYADRTVVEHVEDPALEISLVDAQKTNTNAEIGDVMKVEIQSKEFGRIATQNAKNVILQKIREEERKVLYDQYYGIEKKW